jgi:hypothetical protein
MKKLALAALFATVGGAAMAGALADPIIEPEVIVEHTRTSAAGIIVPILLLVAAAVALR